MTTGGDAFEENLARVLKNNLPDCQGLCSVERLSGGASQETYRLVIETPGDNRTLAMRRSAGGVHSEPAPGYPGLETEALLMESAREAGVPEPEVYYVLKPEDKLGDGFIMEWLEGEALGARIVRSDEFADIRPRLARECGKILARIHGINLKETGLAQKLAALSPEEFVEQTWDKYKALNVAQPMIDYTARWLKDHLPDNFEMALVHNDFRNGNFLLTPEGIAAVLDWEVAHIGDPVRDLGWICTNSWRFGSDLPVGGFGNYEDLFEGYEEESGKRVDPDHVKFWEVFGSFWWAVGCLGMAEHYRTGPDQTVERPAIGRRSSECQVDCVNLLIPGPVELLEPEGNQSTLNMPRTDELVTSVRDFLRDEVMNATDGRLNFMARVASNSLDIVLREMAVGHCQWHDELSRLQALYEKEDELESLRWRLVRDLREGNLSLDDEKLQAYLRNTVVNQIAVDQPRYSGFKTAISQS